MLPLRGNQSQPTLFFVFINERPVSALQSHQLALHKHEWTTLHGLEGPINMNGQLYMGWRGRPSPPTHVELSIHVYVEPAEGFVKPKLVAH
jgi:hypothetical protein